MTEQNSQDPSMEDILSSIRRILSEDEEAAGEDVSEAEAVEEAPQEEIQVEEPEEEPVYEEVVEEVFEEAVPEPEPEPVFEEEVVYEEQPEEVLELTENMEYQQNPNEDEPIISQPVANATACSLAQLAKLVSEDRNISVGGQGLSLEELVREMLKPFLKEWLDANLPYVVERLVKKEIERVVDKAKW